MYDPASRRTRLTLPSGITADYTYDAASQLTGITYKQGSTVVGDLTYTYDRNVPSLSAGSSNSASTSVTIPSNLAAGTYYVGAIADINNTQPESDETNNARLARPCRCDSAARAAFQTAAADETGHIGLFKRPVQAG